jgi:hypothetical protein
MKDSLSVLGIALCNLSDHLEGMTRAVNEVRKCFEDSLPTIEEMAGIAEIPYDKIDPEMRDLIRVMNEYDCVETTGCCFGHGTDLAASVIFNLYEEEDGWGDLRYNILSVNERLDYANIEVSERFYLDGRGNLRSNWVLRIEAHPRNKEVNIAEEDRVGLFKTKAIAELVKMLEEDSK